MRRWLILAVVLLGRSLFSQTLWFTNSAIMDRQFLLNLDGNIGAHDAVAFVHLETISYDLPEYNSPVGDNIVAPFDINWEVLDLAGHVVADGDFTIDRPGDWAFNYNPSDPQNGFTGAPVVPEPSTWTNFALIIFGATGRFLWHRKKRTVQLELPLHVSTRKVSMLAKMVRKIVDVIVPVGRACARTGVRLLALAFLLLGVSVMRADTNFPDTSTLISGPQTGFNTALTWVIGALGVLIVIAWILKAMRRR